MIIKKVVLKNFRSHRQGEFTFQNGVNLILGPNGAGKSSILEAIGLALFDSTSSRDLKSLISRSENGAENEFFVRVEFSGIDGEDYVVERRYSALSSTKNTWVLLKKAGGLPLASGKRIPELVSKLIGIESGDPEEVFRNVLCAYQNDIVSIFKREDEASKKLLNRIFETEFYDRLNEKLGAVQVTYEKLLESLRTKRRVLENVLEDYEGLDERVEQVREELANLQKTERELRDEIDTLTGEKLELSKRVEKLNELKRQIGRLQLELTNLTEQVKFVESQLHRAEEARRNLLKHREGYETYVRADEQLRVTLNRRTELEKRRDEKRNLESRLTETIGRLDREKALVIEKEKLRNDLEVELRSKGVTLKRLEDELTEKMKDLENLERARLTLENELERGKVIVKERDELITRIKTLEAQLVDENGAPYSEKIGKTVTEIQENMGKIKATVEELDKEIITEQELIGRRAALVQRVETLRGSLEKLADGMCPLLLEPCKNASSRGGTEAFVNEQMRNIESMERELREIEERLEMLGKLKKRRDELFSEYDKARSELARLQQALQQISDQELLLKEAKTKLREFEGDYGELFSKIPELEATVQRLNRDEAFARATLTELEKRRKELVSEIDAVTERLRTLSSEISEAEGRCKSFELELNEVRDRLRSFVDVESELDSLNETVEELDRILKNYRAAYEEYLSNERIASELPKFEAERERILKRIGEIEAELTKFTEISASQPDVETLNTRIQEIDGILRDRNAKLNEIVARIGAAVMEQEVLKNRSEERRKKRQELDDVVAKLSVTERKLELTGTFREKLKVMGAEVANQLTQLVAREATEIYGSITGKDERVRIELRDGKYSFKLIDGQKGERQFSQLSGGEQVSLGIALRIALARTLTKSKFYVLDEPTVNLDDERRGLLAENVGKLAGTLWQLIIITHDEEFKDRGYHEIRLDGRQSPP